MGGSGTVALCDMREFPHAAGQTMRPDLQANFSGVQPVAARGCAGAVRYLATCHISYPFMWWLHPSQIAVGCLSCHLCFVLYMGILENAPSLSPACGQGV